jgi:transcriptional regulator with XRE-family HTH domain
MIEVKDLLKNRRRELGYTMKDVANKVGVSEGTISRWESGEIQNMRRNNIVALSKMLKLSPDLIMGWDMNNNQDSNSGTISNNIGSDNSSSTTNNYYNGCGHCDEVAEESPKYYTSQNKDLFFAIIDHIRNMTDEQLLDVVKYVEFVLNK